MYKLICVGIFLLVTSFSFGQEISGQWRGILKVQGIELNLVFNISKTDSGYISTMDSPDQGAEGIPVSNTLFENNTIQLIVKSAGLQYDGKLVSRDSIIGTFKQGGMTFPLNLSKGKTVQKSNLRPQEPQEPFPYYIEEVRFKNKKAGITLAGTLTLPSKDGVYPVVVLISGSGPQDRNETMIGHKPFLVLADYLTRNGIGVLRYDDRGTAESEGNFSTATTFDFSTDTEAAVQFLAKRKDIHKNLIGLIGHSEGGMIAPLVASRNKNIAFIVLMAGSGVPGDELLLLQQKMIGQAEGMSNEELLQNEELNTRIFEMVKKSSDTEKLTLELTEFITEWNKENPSSQKPPGMSDADFVELQVNQIVNPWMLFFIKYDPRPALGKVSCPVLALNGEKDLQVSSKQNIMAIHNAVRRGDCKSISISIPQGVNHLFQECETGSPSEYGQIEQTIAPKVLEEILEWITDLLP